jgi:NAD(P)H-flavin reductase
LSLEDNPSDETTKTDFPVSQHVWHNTDNYLLKVQKDHASVGLNFAAGDFSMSTNVIKEKSYLKCLNATYF